jgi:hypothetical protein
MNERNAIRSILKNYLKIGFKLRLKEQDRDVMNKKLFIESLTILREIEDRRDFMEEEIGLDPTVYEEKFIQVIENLFKMIFNKQQLTLINLYLFDLIHDKDWDGKLQLDLKIGSGEVQQQEFDFRTPAQVWEVVELLK